MSVVVKSRPLRVWDVKGHDHTLDYGCSYFGGTLRPKSDRLEPLPRGTYVFCSRHG